MKRNRLVLGWVAAGSLMALVVLVCGRLVLDRRQLPGIQTYPGLPPIFNTALQSALGKARGFGRTEGDIRRLAHLYQANRLYGEALKCYESRLLSSRHTAQDHYFLADIYQNSGDLVLAAGELRLALDAGPNYTPARLQLAECLFKTGDAKGAEREYTAELAAEANQPQAMYGLARIYLTEADDERAIACLNRLMASHPEMTSGAALLAQVYNRKGESAKAEAMTEWSRQRPEPVPGDPWMDSLLADCYDIQRLGLKFEEYAGTGQIDRALPFLHRLEELDPKSPISPLLRGWEYSRDHNEALAVEEYNTALERGGDPEKIGPYLGQSLLALGRPEDAARLMADLSRRKPDSVPILTCYADVLLKTGKGQEVRPVLERILSREPFHYFANLNMAKILWGAGDRAAAAECLKRVAKIRSQDAVTRGLLAQYFLESGDPASAIGPLMEAEAIKDLKPEQRRSIDAMLYAAYVSLARASGDERTALDYLERAVALAPGESAAYAVEASLYTQGRQFPEAARALRKMGEVEPDNPTVYLSLGDVLYQLGRAKEAVSAWNRAAELTPPKDVALRGALDRRLKAPITAETFQ